MTDQPDPRLVQDQKLLADPATSPTELRRIWEANLDRQDVAEAVATHPKCPKNLYNHFLRYLPEAIKANPAFAVAQGLDLMEGGHNVRPVELELGELEKRLRKGKAHHYIVRAHLQRDDLHRETMAKFAVSALLEGCIDDPEPRVRKALARRPDLPTQWYARLATDTSETVRKALAANPSVPAAVLERLRIDSDAGVRASIIKRGVESSSDQLEALKTKPERRAFAQSCTSPDLLARLATDPSLEVRAAVAGNAATPEAVVRSLARESESDIHKAIGKRSICPEDLLIAIAGAAPTDVRRAMAKNPATPPGVQLMLLDCRDQEVWSGIATNASDERVIQRILSGLRPAQSGDEMRMVLAVIGLSQNPATRSRRDIVDLLLAHRNREVRAQAMSFEGALTLAETLRIFEEATEFDLLLLFSTVAPDYLPDALEVVIKRGDAAVAYEAMFNRAFDRSDPALVPMKVKVLKRLIEFAPRHNKATKARKMLKEMAAALP